MGSRLQAVRGRNRRKAGLDTVARAPNFKQAFSVRVEVMLSFAQEFMTDPLVM